MDNKRQTRPKDHFTDEEIIYQLKHSNGTVENNLIGYLRNCYHGMVVNIVNRLGGNQKDDTDFVLNDALTVLLKKIKDGTYRPDKSSLSTYFHAIAEKNQLNRLRKRKRRKKENGEPFPFQLTLNDVEEKMNSKEVGEKVAAAIRQLDEPCQQVLMKYWLEDKSMQEISKDMNISVDATKQRNHRCMKKLRELLKNEFVDWFKEK